MKKAAFMIMVGILAMPYLTNTLLYGDVYVTKWVNKGTGTSKNVGKTDPVTLGFDEFSNTFTLDFKERVEAVEVSIYKDGALIYQDKDCAEAETTLNYEVSEAERGDYTVTVVADGEPQISESVDVEGDEQD